MGILARILFIVVIIFMYKAGKSLNKFDISETIGHSHKQTKTYKKESDPLE